VARLGDELARAGRAVHRVVTLAPRRLDAAIIEGTGGRRWGAHEPGWPHVPSWTVREGDALVPVGSRAARPHLPLDTDTRVAERWRWPRRPAGPDVVVAPR